VERFARALRFLPPTSPEPPALSVGLLALLDDVAAIAKVAAASLDDVAAQATRAGLKSAGVVIDDTAVTPAYVVGFTADRELPIVMRIALGSLRNKLLFLLPAALALSMLAPWAIMPLLMLGGGYLCYEGAEKVHEWVFPHAHAPKADDDTREATAGTPRQLEDKRVASAIRTDFILSAEIMAITLAAVPASGFWMQAIVLALVGTFITGLVYGAVALIVRADDMGVALARTEREGLPGAAIRHFGRGLVAAMPFLLKALTVVGTAAMLWVGGGIVLHGLASFGLSGPEHFLEEAAHTVGESMTTAPSLAGWLVKAAGAFVVGIALGYALLRTEGALASRG
jgi:predicted DNA repair protein MutK